MNHDEDDIYVGDIIYDYNNDAYIMMKKKMEALQAMRRNQL